jgi:hypothetical protein
MKIKTSFLIICNILIISTYLYSDTTIGRTGKLPLYKKNPVIYDNDDHRDVYTDEYLLALGSIGEIDFKGIITTYAPREYPEFVKGREMIMDLAGTSGLQNLPELFSGTNQKLVRPEDNTIENTKPLDIDGSQFIVEIARKCSFSKPLVIITGGQLTSVANAYLLDPSVADKIVVMGVFGAERIDYNAGLDAWAWTIIMSRFRVYAIPIGPPGNRGKVYMKPPVVPKERIRNELNQEIPFFKWMSEKKHPSNGLPAESDFDGHPAVLLNRSDYVTQWKRFECTGIDSKGYPVLRENAGGNIWQAEDADQQIATDEFWRVMHKLNEKLIKQNHAKAKR